MASVRWLCVAVVLLGVFTCTQQAPNLAGTDYVFEVKDGNHTCLYASFRLDFVITYRQYPNSSDHSKQQIMSRDIHLPNNKVVQVSGDCGPGERVLDLSWSNNVTEYNASITFTVTNDSWYITLISFQFNLDSLSDAVDSGKQTYITDDKNFFGRHFSRGEYFHCERCKEFTFTNCSEDAYVMGKCVFPCLKGADNKTTCTSTVNMMSSIIYPGDIDTENPSKKLCMEDYIALQELIVPIVVGGILAILLLLIFIAYIIAYIRRRRKEGRYKRLSDGTY